MGIAAIGDAFMRLCFPPQCAGCRARLPISTRFDTVCDACFAAIPRDPWIRCSICHARIPAASPERAGGRPACHPAAPLLLAPASDYRDPTVRELIRMLKYRPVRRAALPLAALVAERVTEFGDTLPHVPLPLVPVPLHPRRERERGWNQAVVLAEAVAALLPGRFSVRNDLIRRVRDTSPQARTGSRAERVLNLRDAFECIRGGDVGRPDFVFLIDDVSTTGATLSEAARALRRANVRAVIGLAAAAA